VNVQTADKLERLRQWVFTPRAGENGAGALGSKFPMAAPRQSIGRARAVALYGSQWWVGRGPREIAKFQLHTVELCLPFEVFHQAVEAALGRSVWLHEFGLNVAGLIQELFDERDAPTLDDILDLLPPDKRPQMIVEP
jgi:hypothetical protein